MFPRPYSVVRAVEDNSDVPSDLLDHNFVFLGTVPNAPGRCIVASLRTGRILAGHFTHHFVEVDPDTADILDRD